MYHRIALLSSVMLLTFCAIGQESADSNKSQQNPIVLHEFVYSANKFRENKKNIVQPITIIKRSEIRHANVQTTPTLLEQTGKVYVQRSQGGGGSPVIRGFEASRVLLVVDGVRMNNAIYRSGHLQNLITVDNNMLQSLEVMFGPASTLYGSDALGGVIVMNTIKPKLNSIGGSALVRYSSANNEATGHADFSIGGKKFASLTSITYSDFKDTRQGDYKNPFYGNPWDRNQYVTRINGQDSIVNNKDRNIQKFSGYTQVDLMQKVLFQQSKHVSHLLNLQYSNSSNIPRYDRLTDTRNGALRFAEWSYGPQQRAFAAYQLSIDSANTFFDELKLNASYQDIEESRLQRSYRNNNRQERVEKVNVAGVSLDIRKFLGRHEVTAGIDGQYNNVNSTAQSRNINTGALAPLDTRYPDGGSTMLLAAVYAQHLWKIIPGKLVLNDGLRLNYTQLDAKFNNKDFFPFPFNTASQQNTAVSGNLGLICMPSTRWRIALGSSTGFRAPNVDDLAKVFESVSGSRLVVPNTNLRPEYTYNVDVNLSYFVGDKLKIEADGFYTWFDNAIVVDKFSLRGQDSILYNGNYTGIAAAQNKANAKIYGFSSWMTIKCNEHVSIYGGVTYTRGVYNDAAGKETPLDHIPPVYGKVGILYQQCGFRGEAFSLFNGAKRIQDYSPSGEDNLQYATVNGMPAWYTLNVRTSYQVTRAFLVSAALENVLDYNYRTFSSGISSPGRNLVLTARYRL
jgi:hemoglobin/transferrin/lactoferrin receptor protein